MNFGLLLVRLVVMIYLFVGVACMFWAVVAGVDEPGVGTLGVVGTVIVVDKPYNVCGRRYFYVRYLSGYFDRNRLYYL